METQTATAIFGPLREKRASATRVANCNAAMVSRQTPANSVTAKAGRSLRMDECVRTVKAVQEAAKAADEEDQRSEQQPEVDKEFVPFHWQGGGDETAMRVIRLAAFDVRAKRLRPRHGAGIALIHPAVAPRFLRGKGKVNAGVVLAAQKFDGDVTQPRKLSTKRLKSGEQPCDFRLRRGGRKLDADRAVEHRRLLCPVN